MASTTQRVPGSLQPCALWTVNSSLLSSLPPPSADLPTSTSWLTSDVFLHGSLQLTFSFRFSVFLAAPFPSQFRRLLEAHPSSSSVLHTSRSSPFDKPALHAGFLSLSCRRLRQHGKISIHEARCLHQNRRRCARQNNLWWHRHHRLSDRGVVPSMGRVGRLSPDRDTS